MRVLVFHGYLLSGIGSNVYNASLARALARLGHEVHLVCQDRSETDLAAGTQGSVQVHNPDIGGLLPVFVHDNYEGFEVKTFAELSEQELDSYLARNIEFVSELVGRLGGVDAAVANHLVMAPVVLARAGLRYALKIHGSDLSYTVLPELERFGPYAREAVAGANGILVGSGHIADRLELTLTYSPRSLPPNAPNASPTSPPSFEAWAHQAQGNQSTTQLEGVAGEGGPIRAPAGSARWGVPPPTGPAR